MEQREASLTQKHLTMLAHCLGLPDILIIPYSLNDSKLFLTFILPELLEAAKIALSTISCLLLFMESLWAVQPIR